MGDLAESSKVHSQRGFNSLQFQLVEEKSVHIWIFICILAC